jgi:hypothetical protein
MKTPVIFEFKNILKNKNIKNIYFIMIYQIMVKLC